MRKAIVATVTVLTLGVAAGGYAYADAKDVVPGWITDAPEPAPPAPFPSSADAAPLEAAVPVTLVNADAPIPKRSAIQALAEELRDDPRTGTSTAVSVVDIETGEVLAAVLADDPQIPASNNKILTAIGAYLGLGPDYTMRTTVTWSGAGNSGATPITLVASGDMMLAAKYGHGDVTLGANKFAGMADLADQTVAALEAADVKRVTLRMDDSAFEGPAINPHWPESAITYGYVAPVTGLAVDLGKIESGDYPPRFADPSMAAAEVFAKRLRERGVTVDAVEDGTSRKKDVELAAVESAPMIDVITHMLHESDNTIAEVLVMVLALDHGKDGSIAAGTKEVMREARGLGLALDGVVMDDGSGFSRYNQLTAEALTGAYVFFANDPALDDVIRRLPVSGLYGTMDERLDGKAAGMVRAKTGSLTGVTSLSGTILTADGRWLAFAVLADGMPYGQDAPRAAIDKFVSAMAACGCG